MNFGPKGILIMPTSGKEIQFLSCHPNPGTKFTQQQLEDILRSARGKGEFLMPFSPFMDLLYRYRDGDMLLLRNSGSFMNGETRQLS